MVVEMIGVAIAFVLGWLCLRPFASVTGYGFVAVAALPIGIALWGACSAALIAAMIPFNPFAGLLLAGSIVGAINFRRDFRPTRIELFTMAIGGALSVLAALVFAKCEWSIFNSDMHWTLYMADNLIDSGFLSDSVREVQLGAEPIYLPLVSAYARWFGEIYFMSLSALMLTCTGTLFIVSGIHAAKPSQQASSVYQIWVSVLGALALMTTGFYVINVLQVKTHGVFALHMLGACTALYFAGRDGKPAWFIVALIFTAPMDLFRLESGVSGFPILIVAVAISTIPLKLRLLGVAAVAAVWGLSYLYLLGAITYSPSTGWFERGLVSKRLFFIGAAPGLLSAVLLVIVVINWNGRYTALLSRLVSWLPAAMIVALLVVLIGHAVVLPETAWISVGGFASILTDSGMGGIGYGVAILVLLPLSLILRPRIAWAWVVMVPALSYIIILALADVHLDGFPHWGQTGAITRIASHVLPTLFFYVLLRFIAPDQREPV